VRVDRLEKRIASVLPKREVLRPLGSGEPDFVRVLCCCALRIRVVSSDGVRSAMLRRWRGANGDVCPVLYEHPGDRLSVRRVAAAGRRRRWDGGMIASMACQRAPNRIEVAARSNGLICVFD
jgi:hypothetical protein